MERTPKAAKPNDGSLFLSASPRVSEIEQRKRLIQHFELEAQGWERGELGMEKPDFLSAQEARKDADFLCAAFAEIDKLRADVFEFEATIRALEDAELCARLDRIKAETK